MILQHWNLCVSCSATQFDRTSIQISSFCLLGKGWGGGKGGGTEYLWLQLKQLAGNIDSICHAFLHQRGEREKIIGGAKDDCH